MKRKDAWGQEVLGRIEFTSDLHAYDAVYHQQCSSNFRTFKSKPKETTYAKKGRPSLLNESFLYAISYLEDNEDIQISVSDLVEKMAEHCGPGQAYGQQYVKGKLKEHFGERVLITEMQGKPNIVTLVKNAKNYFT